MPLDQIHGQIIKSMRDAEGLEEDANCYKRHLFYSLAPHVQRGRVYARLQSNPWM